MKHNRSARKNGKREVMENLCKTGEWVGLTILALRMEISPDAARTALRELIADGFVETKELPRKWTVMQREKVYRAAPGADASKVPIVPLEQGGTRRYDDAGAVLGIVMARGHVQTSEVADTMKVSSTHAGRVLKDLVDSGALVRSLGPKPPVGSVRPWIYEVAP